MSRDLSQPCSPRLLSRSRRGWGRCGVGWDRKRALSHATGPLLFIWDIKPIFAVNTQALFLGCCSQLQQLHQSHQRPTAGARLHLGAGPAGMRPTRSHRECRAAGAGLGLGLLPLPCPACTHGQRRQPRVEKCLCSIPWLPALLSHLPVPLLSLPIPT